MAWKKAPGSRREPARDELSQSPRAASMVKAGPAWQWGVLRSGGDKIGSDGGFAGRFGAGLDIYITKNIVFATGANYMLPTSDINPHYS